MEIKPIIHKPISIFLIINKEIKKLYFELYEQFPRDLDLFVTDQHGKLRIENASRQMASIMRKKPWKKLLNVFDQEVINQLVSKFIPDGRYAAVSINPLLNIKNKYLKRKILVTTSYEFSTLLNGAQLVPHTDSTNKIITMMMYFPTTEQEGRDDLGTVFHKFSGNKKDQYENFNNQHYSADYYPNFYNDAEDLYRIPFSSEGIYGFVKGSHSWHSLPTVKLDEGEFRRSLNINVYLFKRSVFSPLYFKNLMRLKLLILGV